MKTLNILGWRFTIERRARVRMCLDAEQEYRHTLKSNPDGSPAIDETLLHRRECLLVLNHGTPHAYGEWQRL